MIIYTAIEYNDHGYMAHAVNIPGAYGRDKKRYLAIEKLKMDVRRYCLWLNKTDVTMEICIVDEIQTNAVIEDGDTDIIFQNEKEVLTQTEYEHLKELVLKSANDFQLLYTSIPKKLFLIFLIALRFMVQYHVHQKKCMYIPMK